MTQAAHIGVEIIDQLLADPTVTEIMINGPDRVFVERNGKKQDSGLHFESEQRLRYAIERLLEANPGARVDMSSPLVDLALPDGSRIHVAVPPVVVGGPHLTIRKFNRPVHTPEDLVSVGTMDERMAWFLGEAVRGKTAVLYSGATGTGKTTMLECMMRRIQPSERIIIIEDSLELHVEQPNVVRMLARASNIEGRGAISLGELFRNSLHMRPNRVILGEIRGDEVIDYLQAINSGHRGSQAIIHAANAHEAVLRMQQLALMSGRGADRASVSHQIIEGLELIVQIDQHSDGVRRATAITEVMIDPDDATAVGLRDIFLWVPEGLSRGEVRGRYVATGHRPACVDRLRLAGMSVPDDLFLADPEPIS